MLLQTIWHVKKDKVGNISTLLIGSAGRAISSSATFTLEVACGKKHMQAGVVNGRDYDNMLHAVLSILEKEGVMGLYGWLGPDFIKNSSGCWDLLKYSILLHWISILLWNMNSEDTLADVHHECWSCLRCSGTWFASSGHGNQILKHIA
ncbi:putative mitochondrial carrier domain superfamily [Helianthus annuus]|nr:putative mitochondrial carrier domain superfamily [Helianthus annuus]